MMSCNSEAVASAEYANGRPLVEALTIRPSAKDNGRGST